MATNETDMERDIKDMRTALTANEAELGALKAAKLADFYAKLNDAEAQAKCEEARTAYHSTLPLLQAAHDALAGKGREGKFKEWCGLAGINYDSARNMIARAKNGRKNGSKRGSVNPANTLDPFTYPTEQELKQAKQRLDRLIKNGYAATYGEALLKLLIEHDERTAAKARKQVHHAAPAYAAPIPA
jgi:hypothetical protein